MADTRKTSGANRGVRDGGARAGTTDGAGVPGEVDVEEFERIADEAEGSHDVSASPHVCSVAFCPISMALSAVEAAKPDAVEHLLAAGREFLLATKAVLDARAAQAGGGSTKLEKIDIG